MTWPLAVPIPPTAAWTLLGRSTLALHLGRYDVALEGAARALAIGRALGDVRLVVYALTLSGVGFHADGQPSLALASYNEACATARSNDDATYLSRALNGIAEIHRDAGNLTDAEAFYEQSLGLARAQGNASGASTILSNLASLWTAMGKLDRARTALVEFLALSRAIGNRGNMECVGDCVAALAAASADHPTAARFHGAALTLMHEAGARHEPVDEAFFAGWIAQARAAMGPVAFDAAEAEGKTLSADAAIAEMDRWLARSV